MQSRLLTTLILLFLSHLSLLAHDFAVKNADGVTIYYKMFGSSECFVTYYGDKENSAKYSGSITIPSSVTYAGLTLPVTAIGNCAFYGCQHLHSITLPNTIESIGSSAFRYCTGLTSISLPSSVTSISSLAFCECTGLTSVNFPSNLKIIGYDAFGWCSQLSSITIPKSVTSIEEMAFRHCTGLRSVTVLSDTPPTVKDKVFIGARGSEITLYVPKGSTSRYANAYGWRLFPRISEGEAPQQFSAINSDGVNICYLKLSPSTCAVTYFDDSTTSAKYTGSINIPSHVSYNGRSLSVTTISYAAFYYCTSLTSITLPNSINYIGKYAFSNCTALTSITIHADTPPTVSNVAFEKLPLSRAILHVPTDTKAKYTAANNWKNFDQIIEF